METEIKKITNTYNAKEECGKYVDVIIYIKQGENIVILHPNDLLKLEDVVGAKFKC